MPEPTRHTMLQLTEQQFRDWLDLHGRKLYADFYGQLRADLDERLRKHDARWQSLSARMATLATTLGERLDQVDTHTTGALADVATALYALKREVEAQRTTHRDPFGVFAALLRDLAPEGLRAGHAIWRPPTVDAYLRTRWHLADPELRRYKAVWRDAHLIAVERESFSRKFTVQRGIVAYRFAVPVAVFDLFHVAPPSVAESDTETGTEPLPEQGTAIEWPRSRLP